MRSANYRGVIAIHSTTLGPAVGGTRIWNYPSDEAATYVPDYVANAGGVVHGCRELLGWAEIKTKQRVDQIYETVIGILKSAGSATAPFRVANRLAERKLALNKS